MHSKIELTNDRRPPTTGHCFLAVDLGAGSGRVFLCDLGERFELEEIHRFHYPPRQAGGHLRWDFARIFGEIKTGLKNASACASERGVTITSLGVDSWAVDYGLLDAAGHLLADPVCYRDARTNGAFEKVFARVSRAEIFARTGIQHLPFNTIFQLASEDENSTRAARMLLLPDLINYFLTGKACAEYTNATTTQLVNAATEDWDAPLIEKLRLPAGLLPSIVKPGTDLGLLKEELAAELGLAHVRVVATASHDTASAVAGAPLRKGDAYISSGTWSLVGVELDAPLVTDEAARLNFTNEGGADGAVRFLKNVMGLWIFESCRREWQEKGVAADYATLLAEAGRRDDFPGFIYPDDERFLNPVSMLAAIGAQLGETGQTSTDDPIALTKIVLDSLAFRYASVLEAIGTLTGRTVETVQIVGGGGRNEYLNQMTADASGKTVSAGLTEATVTGNCLVQAVAAGRFADLAEARAFVARHTALKSFAPRVGLRTGAARREYQRIEQFFQRPRAEARA